MCQRNDSAGNNYNEAPDSCCVLPCFPVGLGFGVVSLASSSSFIRWSRFHVSSVVFRLIINRSSRGNLFSNTDDFHTIPRQRLQSTHMRLNLIMKMTKALKVIWGHDWTRIKQDVHPDNLLFVAESLLENGSEG